MIFPDIGPAIVGAEADDDDFGIPGEGVSEFGEIPEAATGYVFKCHHSGYGEALHLETGAGEARKMRGIVGTRAVLDVHAERETIADAGDLNGLRRRVAFPC